MATVTLDQLVVDLIFKGSTKDLNKFEQGVKNLNKRIDGLARNFTLAGGALSAALFGVGRTILNFEQAMNNLQAVLNPTAEDRARLRTQAKDMGRTTAFSASQAAAAQTELAQAGFEVKEILTAMPHVLRLAAAGQLDIGEAAALVVNQLNAYGLEASEAQRVTDVIAKTASHAPRSGRQEASRRVRGRCACRVQRYAEATCVRQTDQPEGKAPGRRGIGQAVSRFSLLPQSRDAPCDSRPSHPPFYPTL